MTDKNTILDCLYKLKDSYDSLGYFVIDENKYSISQMITQIEMESKIGKEFVSSITETILLYMMKFKASE